MLINLELNKIFTVLNYLKYTVEYLMQNNNLFGYILLPNLCCSEDVLAVYSNYAKPKKIKYIANNKHIPWSLNPYITKLKSMPLTLTYKNIKFTK